MYKTKKTNTSVPSDFLSILPLPPKLADNMIATTMIGISKNTKHLTNQATQCNQFERPIIFIDSWNRKENYSIVKLIEDRIPKVRFCIQIHCTKLIANWLLSKIMRRIPIPAKSLAIKEKDQESTRGFDRLDLISRT